MDNDEDVRRMAAEVSKGNRYYGINLTNIARDRVLQLNLGILTVH